MQVGLVCSFCLTTIAVTAILWPSVAANRRTDLSVLSAREDRRELQGIPTEFNDVQLQEMSVPLGSDFLFQLRSNCEDLVDHDPTIRPRMATLCNIFHNYRMCLNLPETIPVLYFENCTRKGCSTLLSNEQSICLTNGSGIDLRGIDYRNIEECNVLNTDLSLFQPHLLPYVNKVGTNANSNCFIAQPRGGNLTSQVECVDDLPRLRLTWNFYFPKEASPHKFYNCLFDMRCNDNPRSVSLCYHPPPVTERQTSMSQTTDENSFLLNKELDPPPDHNGSLIQGFGFYTLCIVAGWVLVNTFT